MNPTPILGRSYIWHEAIGYYISNGMECRDRLNLTLVLVAHLA